MAIDTVATNRRKMLWRFAQGAVVIAAVVGFMAAGVLQSSYNKLANEHVRLQRSHKQVVANYEQLKVQHSALEAQYASLQSQHRALQISAQQMAQEYQALASKSKQGPGFLDLIKTLAPLLGLLF